jgi:hypothetical protein
MKPANRNTALVARLEAQIDRLFHFTGEHD